MPPFLYNRISQPFCSFALPPPLPQIGSLPLTPAVQQMVMQRYSNPVAVLPFAPSWQMPMMMMPNYPQYAQQQQQYMTSMPALPALPAPPQPYIPPPPQAYIPSSAPVAVPSLPPAPQAYIPPPLPPPPQVYIPPPPTVVPSLPPTPAVISSLPPVPQTYNPPPSFGAFIPAPPPFPGIPQGHPMPFSPPTSQYPSSSTDAASSSSYNNYPSICRACPPAPPPLTINVTGHCWIQHCSACHHVPNSISNPNSRPNGGRITPLLLQPAVPQYVPEQTGHQYNHTNPPVMMRPWLRKTPPLPPGAVVIYDEYINKRNSRSRHGQSNRRNKQEAHDSRDHYRSTTVSSRKTNGIANSGATRNHKSMSPKTRSNNNNTDAIQQQGFFKTKGSGPLSSSSTSSSGVSGEYEKITFLPAGGAQQNTIPSPLTREARNVNLQYKYQPEELPTVYLNNQYLKSSSEASTPGSNIETPLNHSPQLSQNLSSSPTSSSSSSTRSKSLKNNLQHEKENGLPPRSPSHLKTPKQRLVIIREFMTSSPSTISTISSNMSFSIIDKDDDDALSTTSTIRADQFEGDDVPVRHVF